MLISRYHLHFVCSPVPHSPEPRYDIPKVVPLPFLTHDVSLWVCQVACSTALDPTYRGYICSF